MQPDKKTLKIYTVLFKDAWYYADDHYIPIQAGKAVTGIEMDAQILTDNTGDNISARNACFGELTATYWEWKNLKGVDYIGHCHYRRYLAPKPPGIGIKPWYDIRQEKFRKLKPHTDRLRELLQEYDFVVGRKWDILFPLDYMYAYRHHKADLQILRDVLAEMQPEYLAAYDKFIRGTKAYMCTIYVTRWELFDKYCAWVFPILFEVERRIDTTDYPPYQKRVCAYLNERLFTLFLLHNRYKIKELPFYMIGGEQADQSPLQQDLRYAWQQWSFKAIKFVRSIVK